jgi:hypothetical protein
MGEVIEFKRRKMVEYHSVRAPLPINLWEPITAAEFPTWSQAYDTAPSEYCAPESDSA